MIPEPDPHAKRRKLLVAELRLEGVEDERVLDALAAVPRHEFVPPQLVGRAYENRALPIGDGQTISQPFVVAVTTAALALQGDEKVLEVGTGSGYQAAVLAKLAREVHTIERNPRLHQEARARLERLGLTNVICHLGDGSGGVPAEAPFDAICVTAASPQVPPPLRAQLAPGGRLVIPVGTRRQQALRLITAAPAGDRANDISRVVFVPLIGEHGWEPAEPGWEAEGDGTGGLGPGEHGGESSGEGPGST